MGKLQGEGGGWDTDICNRLQNRLRPKLQTKVKTACSASKLSDPIWDCVDT